MAKGACVVKGGMGGKGACMAREHVWQGACMAGVCRTRVGGGMCGKEACVAGGHAWQGGMRGRRDGHCSGRYASSWNTFLFPKIKLKTNKQKTNR